MTEAAAQDEAQRVADAQRMETLTDTVEHLHQLLSNTLESCQLMIGVLQLRGVRKWLLEKFHPDKYPNANAAQREALENAAAQINAAYDVVKQQATTREE